MSLKPRLFFQNEQLIMTLPVRYMNAKELFHYCSGIYLHCFLALEKEKYSFIHDNIKVSIEHSYIHQLYNVPVNHYCKLKINNYYSTYHNLVYDNYNVKNNIIKKQLPIDIYNETNELYGYINHSIDIIR
jgi:hypothetical protein